MARRLTTGVYWIPTTNSLEVPVGEYSIKHKKVVANGELIPVSCTLDEVRSIVQREMNAKGLPQAFNRRRKLRKYNTLQYGIQFELDTDEEHEYLIERGTLTSWSGFVEVGPLNYDTIAQMIYALLQRDYIRGFVWEMCYVRFYKLKNSR